MASLNAASVFKKLPLLVTAVAFAFPGVSGAQDQRPLWLQQAQAAWKYPKLTATRDIKIRMSDGTDLAADLYRPADQSGAAINQKLPTIVNIGPYNKNVMGLVDGLLNDNQVAKPIIHTLERELTKLGSPYDGLPEVLRGMKGGSFDAISVPRNLVQNGYNVLMVDARGTGSSLGTWDVLGKREQQDSLEVLEWARTQTWSNGNLGMGGVSYSGINSVQAASKRPPGLKAIFPIVPSEDLGRETVMPGGAAGAGFMPLWLGVVNALKWFPPLDTIGNPGAFDRWKADRDKDPATLILNGVLPALVCGVDCTDMASPGSSFYKNINPGNSGEIEKIQVPTFVVGGWQDIFTHGEPRIFNRLKLPDGQKKLMMGDWYHLTIGDGLGESGAPPKFSDLMLAWYDRWVKGENNGIDKEATAHLYQQGNGWIATSSFPRQGAHYKRISLNTKASGTASHAQFDGGLSLEQSDPVRSSSPGVTQTPSAKFTPSELSSDQQVNYDPKFYETWCSRSASIGTISLAAIFGGSDCTRDNRTAEKAAATFTSQPVTATTTVSGPIAAELDLIADSKELFTTVVLSDVAPDGMSTSLTEGELLLSRRKVDPELAQKADNGSYADPIHSHTKESILPVVAGQKYRVEIGLKATDFMLKPGHRLRMSVFSANLPKTLPLFPDLFNTAFKSGKISINSSSPGFINLPVVDGGF